MKILGIETSCDETAAAVVENGVSILSNQIASQVEIHARYGGIVPEVASRQHILAIIPILKQAMAEAKVSWSDLAGIAVTIGPGLAGSLLVGVETAKTLAYLWKKPIIPVNHLLGHIYANWICPQSSVLSSQFSESSQSVHRLTGKLKTDKLGSENRQQKTDNRILFPALALLVSGGHTDLVVMKSHHPPDGGFKWLGGTLDDAAGEAFDKIGRLLNLPYPAGPVIEAIAKKGNLKAFNFPRPMIGSKDFDFSFSGLKAAVWRETKRIKELDNEIVADICACVQKSIVEVLVRKTMKAAKKYNVKSILLGGGVAANQKLREALELEIKNWELDVKLFYPEKSLCTDNAAMIGAYAAFHPEKVDWKKVTANPELYFE